MPYIEQSTRDKFQKSIDNLPGIDNPGELNYLLYSISRIYLKQHGLRYQYLNDISGAFFNCAMELYRKDAAPYEDIKIEANGDVDGHQNT